VAHIHRLAHQIHKIGKIRALGELRGADLDRPDVVQTVRIGNPEAAVSEFTVGRRIGTRGKTGWTTTLRRALRLKDIPSPLR
ncbi:hypothetical protein ACFL0Q_09870, partial [Thermodesulfobacteriota bacterium]